MKVEKAQQRFDESFSVVIKVQSFHQYLDDVSQLAAGLNHEQIKCRSVRSCSSFELTNLQSSFFIRSTSYFHASSFASFWP
jgi:hypothetical protein